MSEGIVLVFLQCYTFTYLKTEVLELFLMLYNLELFYAHTICL